MLHNAFDVHEHCQKSEKETAIMFAGAGPFHDTTSATSISNVEPVFLGLMCPNSRNTAT